MQRAEAPGTTRGLGVTGGSLPRCGGWPGSHTRFCSWSGAGLGNRELLRVTEPRPGGWVTGVQTPSRSGAEQSRSVMGGNVADKTPEASVQTHDCN